MLYHVAFAIVLLKGMPLNYDNLDNSFGEAEESIRYNVYNLVKN